MRPCNKVYKSPNKWVPQSNCPVMGDWRPRSALSPSLVGWLIWATLLPAWSGKPLEDGGPEQSLVWELPGRFDKNEGVHISPRKSDSGCQGGTQESVPLTIQPWSSRTDSGKKEKRKTAKSGTQAFHRPEQAIYLVLMNPCCLILKKVCSTFLLLDIFFCKATLPWNTLNIHPNSNNFPQKHMCSHPCN